MEQMEGTASARIEGSELQIELRFRPPPAD